MATFVKGDAVANARSYELLEKVGETYNSLAEASEINFEVSAMDFAEGDHLLAVRAKGDGVNYSDSDPSDTVTYTVASAPVAPADELAGTWLMNETIDTTNFGGTKGVDMGIEGMTLYKGYKVNYTSGSNVSEYLLTHTSVAGILAYCKLGTSAAAFLYNDGKWSVAANRTIVITSTLAEVTNGDVLLAWLNANGVKQS